MLLGLGCSEVDFQEIDRLGPPTVDRNNRLEVPDEPEAPPLRRFPSITSDVAAVVFEDSFPRPADADYNDFLANFVVTELVNKQEQVTSLVIDFYPRALGASYDHSFLLVLDGIKDQPSNLNLITKPLFFGGAEVTLSHFNSNGELLRREEGLDYRDDVVVFESTHDAFRAERRNQVINTYVNRPYVPPAEMARLEIKLTNPELNPVGERAKGFDLSKLRMVLHVKNTNQDIDIVDVDPMNFDSNGYPFGFVIPSNWRWPQEGVSVDSIYPVFQDYRNFLLDLMMNPGVLPIPEIASWFRHMRSGSSFYPEVDRPKLLPPPVVDTGSIEE